MKDAIMGFFFIVLGVITITTANQYPTMSSLQYGPSLFPSLIGGGAIIGGLILVIAQLPLLKQLLSSTSSGNLMEIDYRSIFMAFFPCAMIVFYILAGEHLGAALSLAAIMLLLMLIRKVSLSLALVSSMVAAFAIYLVFSRYLLIPLPEGLLSIWGNSWM